MFHFRKSVEEKSVEEFVRAQSSGALTDDDSAGERKGAPEVSSWLLAAIVSAAVLFALCLAAFAKIGHLSRDVALLRSQMAGKAAEDVTARIASLSARLAKSDSEADRLRSRSARLERDVEVMKQANAHETKAKTKMVAKKEGAEKKKTRPH
ncbi:MAG: hypothetical protein ABSD38_26585 [Syntrophorhabdales bacterium]|jgi:hypothetical protein